MRKYLVLAAVPAVFSACAMQPEMQPPKPEPKEARVSVRLVEHKSDVARIAPGYEMVAGISRHVIDTKAEVKWINKGGDASTTGNLSADDAKSAKQLIDPRAFLDKIMADVHTVNPKADPMPVPGAAPASPEHTAAVIAAPSKSSGAKAKPLGDARTIVLDDSSFSADGKELNKEAIAQLDSAANDAGGAQRAVVVAGQITDSDERRQVLLLEKRSEMVFAYLQKKGCSVGNISRVGFAAGSQTDADETGTHRSEIIAVIGGKGDTWTK